jgi:hypothetical protein
MTIADVCVDDLTVFSNICSEKHSLKTELKNEFECEDMESTNCSLGKNVER